ncbi:hypothetical protein K458DRAFT_407146 [Lentithecium fluviatile CBS 122367]|uniref:DUF7492 domain-containing protein n=1 Tax=Lentithecium fluviatile CBS 122367 TaxID=1168545 RepID=A0A6G1IR84_9PLEO|nr:hypothetical protein K458DRAFT_407146 [Lentithecium fluviatile CBS 122367]
MLTLFLLFSGAYAHSWVERAYAVRDGMLVGAPGFPRGNVLRTPTFRDTDMVYHLPPPEREPNVILPGDIICKDSQATRNYTDGSPMLSARVQDHIMLMYQENGHVTKIKDDFGHNRNSGTVTVIGTMYSLPTDTLQGVLSAASKNTSSQILRIASFNDGNCYQANGTPEAEHRKSAHQRLHLEIEGPDLWCSQNVQLPSHIQPGDVYTLYWLWDFDGVGFEERYTTCLDIQVVA